MWYLLLTSVSVPGDGLVIHSCFLTAYLFCQGPSEDLSMLCVLFGVFVSVLLRKTLVLLKVSLKGPEVLRNILD